MDPGPWALPLAPEHRHPPDSRCLSTRPRCHTILSRLEVAELTNQRTSPACELTETLYAVGTLALNKLRGP
jgi:hypothetical protein